MRGSFHRRKATTVGLGVVAVGATLGLFAVGAVSQQTGGLTIYRGETAQEAGFKPFAWGSGTVVEDPQMHFSGTHSLRIATHGMYQGAGVSFKKPVDLAPFLSNKNAYLQFVVSIPETVTTTGGASGGVPGGFGPPGFSSGGGRPGTSGGGFPGGGFPGAPGGGFPGFGRGGGRGGVGGQGGETKAQAQKARNIEKLRVVLLTASDRSIEFLLPLEYARTTEQQWKQLSIPVMAVPGLKADDAQIKEMRIFADVPGTVYLGQARVVTDVTPVTIDRIGEKVIPRNSRYTYTVKASAGVIPLKVAWDFDEADGIQEEKIGRTVIFRYTKTGDFVATVTVSDLYGMMEPKTLKFKVHVTP
jgi:hypothetical protein